MTLARLPKPLWTILLLLIPNPRFVGTVYGVSSRVTWEELPQHLESESIPLMEFGLCDCPANLEGQTADRSVAQYIENTFYLWDEYDLPGDGDGTQCCVMMRKPLRQPLTIEEAQVLLTASTLWFVRSTPVTSSGRPPFGIRSIVGDDDRVRIEDTELARWYTYCYLEVQYKDGGYSTRATGVIVGPHVALTCAHAVYDRDRGLRPDVVTLVPAQNGDTTPLGEIKATDWAFDPRFPSAVKPEQGRYDCAAVFFYDYQRSDRIQTYPPVRFSTPLAVGDAISVAGYPASVNGDGQMSLWNGFGRITAIEDNIVYHDTDTSRGQSGAPVWEGNGIVAINFAELRSRNAENLAVALDSHNAAMIQQWMEWSPSQAPSIGVSLCDLLAPTLTRTYLVVRQMPDLPLMIPQLLHWTSKGASERVSYQNDANDYMFDGSDVVVPIYVPDTGRVMDAYVTINLQRQSDSPDGSLDFASDTRRIELIAPDGAKLRLKSDTDLVVTSGLQYRFQDTDEVQTTLQEIYYDSMLPVEPLKTLIGKQVHGTWAVVFSASPSPCSYSLYFAIDRPDSADPSVNYRVIEEWPSGVPPRNFLTSGLSWYNFSGGIYRVAAYYFRMWFHATGEGFERSSLDSTFLTWDGDVVLSPRKSGMPETAVVGAGSSAWAMPPEYLSLVAYECTRTSLMTKIGTHLSFPRSTGSHLHFVVYESAWRAGPYHRIYVDTLSDQLSDGRISLYESQDMEVLLRSGRYYLIGVGCADQETNHQCGSPGATTPFGNVLGVAAPAYMDVLAGPNMPPEQASGYIATDWCYHHELTVFPVDYPIEGTVTSPLLYCKQSSADNLPMICLDSWCSDTAWARLGYGVTLDGGTEVRVEVLDGLTNEVLALDIRRPGQIDRYRGGIVELHQPDSMIRLNRDYLLTESLVPAYHSPIRLRATLSRLAPVDQEGHTLGNRAATTPVLHWWGIQEELIDCSGARSNAIGP